MISCVLFHDNHGRYLVVRKRATTAFQLPGGKIDDGESALQAARREICEELGVRLKDDDLQLRSRVRCPAANEPGVTIDAVVWDCAVEISPKPMAEIEEVRWVRPEDPGVPLAPLLADYLWEAHPALAELVIDLDAIAHNAAYLAQRVAPAKLMAVVKADAYNHGVSEVARTVLEHGAAALGVATIAEALHLRELGVTAPITAWMWHPGEALAPVFANHIELGLPSLAHARVAIAAAREYVGDSDPANPSSTVPLVGLMADTGLSRSGVSPVEWSETVRLVAQASRAGWVRVGGVFSHLASADMPDQRPTTDRQAERFRAAIEDCCNHGLDVPCNHLANTPATLTRPDLHFDMVRPGVGLYGVDPVEPFAGYEPADLRPAMTLRARVTTTRIVPRGEGVSYGHMWVAQEDTRTAVVAIGYADGLLRSLSGNLQVAIGGRLYQQIGRVCMDQIVVNLGPVGSPEAEAVTPGEWAVIFGAGGLSAEELARRAGTIAYEILTMPRGPRVARRCISSGRHLPQRPDHLRVSGGRTTVATAEDMRALGEALGSQLSAGTVVVLTGPLGAGKTTFTQGLAAGLGVQGRVQSPTFTVVRQHRPGFAADGGRSRPGLLHMDAYRLLGDRVEERQDVAGRRLEPGELMDRGEVLDSLESLDVDADIESHVVVAEWGRGIVEGLSKQVLDVEITRVSGAGPDDTEWADDPRDVTWAWR
nr:alanine racemase [Corynebacterium heidelbergense]